MNSFDAVFALLRSSLFGVDLPSEVGSISDGQWMEIHEISLSQGVHTLVFDAFRKGFAPPKSLLAQWLSEVEQVERRNALITAVAASQEAVWKERGLEYALIKGPVCAAMYPHPEHRLCGDVDWWFAAGDSWDSARRFAGAEGVLEWDSDGDFHYCSRGVVVEHHRGWNHMSGKKASLIAPSVEEGRLSAEDTLLMLLCHMLRHAEVSGVGLKHLCDLAVALKEYDGMYDKDVFASRLRSLKMDRWAATVGAVLVRKFGLSSGLLPVSPDTEYCSKLLFLIREDGNMGLGKQVRFGGFFKRAELFLKLCPGEFCRRYWSLIVGRAGLMLGIIQK